ncbi:hypothetical protein RS130_02700 [Paraglaciecola aquimarina]|uniref:Uncharacterized protein n=1 Tax=Paraglaciecola aquimarina TaxID=1235557 RepID=A0ABU3SSJ4_9ALTE|nr:hypothetical protein [Paraglaciecola aquimarina]MDU0352982.1 hypothetical protein [Paraglaciecola aquimarina]
MQKQKQQLAQAKKDLEVAQKYSQRRRLDAQQKTKIFLSSTTGIASAFGAGAIHGATSKQTQSPVSSLLPMLMRML